MELAGDADRDFIQGGRLLRDGLRRQWAKWQGRYVKPSKGMPP